MGSGLIALNVLFVLFVLLAIPGPILWAIRTAHRDHHPIRRPVMEPPALEPVVAVEAAARVETTLV